jgi:hypothetical protein
MQKLNGVPEAMLNEEEDRAKKIEDLMRCV